MEFLFHNGKRIHIQLYTKRSFAGPKGSANISWAASGCKKSFAGPIGPAVILDSSSPRGDVIHSTDHCYQLSIKSSIFCWPKGPAKQIMSGLKAAKDLLLTLKAQSSDCYLRLFLSGQSTLPWNYTTGAGYAMKDIIDIGR